MARYIKKIILFLFFILFELCFAQDNNLKFKHLLVEDGLSQTTANTIFQDSYGFMWFGTQDGLNRYDGYNFKIYSHETGNKNSLSNNYIWTIYEDSDGILWIGSFGGGLTKFNPRTETYEHFNNDVNDKSTLSSNDIFKILEYPRGTLWLRTGNGVNKFDKKTYKVTRYFNRPGNTNDRNNNYISALEVQPPYYIWVGTDSGLIKLNIKTEKHEIFNPNNFNGNFKFGAIFNLLFDDNNLFVCCDSGLIQINFKSNSYHKLQIPISIRNKNISIRHLLIDKNNYWIGTTKGLILYNKNQKNFQYCSSIPNNQYSLLHNNIVSLYKSKEGIIWVGTYGGINFLDKINQDFSLIQYDPNKKNSLSQKSIGPILEDRNKILWIGTPDGLNAYNRFTHENTIFKNIPEKPGSISSNYILSLFEDSNGNIWIGTRDGGVNKFTYKNISNLKNINFEKVNWNDPLQTSNRIQSIYEDKNGILWFGTGGRGLVRYSPQTGKSKLFPMMIDGTGPSHSYVYSMFEDNKGNFWIGTPTGGLNIFNREEEKFLYIKNTAENLKSLSNNIVLSIFQDRNNKLVDRYIGRIKPA